VKTKTPQIGQPAPVFSLPDADMESVGLASFKGKKNVVLYFYPRDGTPGCTLQAIEFSDHDEEFARHDCVVLGVSPDDCISHAEFRDKHGLSVCLLADPEAEVCEKYGVREVKECDGVKKTCILRATFVIDKKGRLRHALYGVNPRGHAMEVLQLIKEINSECKLPKTR
jgi:peroxiredoxin Q/BCP